MFCVSNRHPAELSLSPLPYSIELPLFLLILFSFLLGAVIAGIAATFSSIKQKWNLLSSRRRIKALENEIGGLKVEKSTALQMRLHE